MKKNYVMICMICALLCSCNSNESNKQNAANNSTYNAEKQEKETQKAVFDALEKSDTQWGDKKVENSKFVFYVSKNSLVQKEKETKEKSILKRWKGKKSISLCCTESELYYIEDMRRVGRIQLENEKTQQLITYEMLEKAGYTFPDIFGMVVYSGHIYLQISGLDVIECGQNGEIGDKIAQDVRYGAFCGNSFFYRRRSSDEIIRFDLEQRKKPWCEKRSTRSMCNIIEYLR